MKKLTHYLKYTWTIIIFSYQSTAIYRADFFLRIIRALLEIIITLTILGSIFHNTVSLGGWSRSEATLVAAISLLTVGMVTLFFGYGMESLHRQIVTGRFDRFLTQPLDSQWLSSTGFIYVTNIFRIIFNLILFSIVVANLPSAPSPSNIFFFIISFVSAMIIYYCLMFSAAVISFWALTGELYYLFNGLTSISKYPIDIFGFTLKTLLTFLPVIFIATIPAQALLGRYNLLIFLSPIIALICLWLTRKFWIIGLHSYDSASS